MSHPWQGTYCALWTPTDQKGQLLESVLEENLRLLKSKGVQGLLALGSTGEFLHLDVAMRRHLMERLVALASPLRLMFNISDIRPAVVAELARSAHQLGAAAVSLLPPYFFPVDQADLIEFFVRAGEAAQLPLFLYNFPERTGNRIALETVAAVAERVPVAGVKQSGAEFGYHSQLVQLGREKGFVVFTGSDTRLPEAVALGVSGCVSGLANAVPELVVEALARAQAEGPGQGGVAAERLAQLGRQIQSVQFPLHVAATMEARGLGVGAPKAIVSNVTQGKYQQLVAELQVLFHAWKLV